MRPSPVPPELPFSSARTYSDADEAADGREDGMRRPNSVDIVSGRTSTASIGRQHLVESDQLRMDGDTEGHGRRRLPLLRTLGRVTTRLVREEASHLVPHEEVSGGGPKGVEEGHERREARVCSHTAKHDGARDGIEAVP